MPDTRVTAKAVIGLGRLALDFGRVDRITYHQDGRTPESDTDHTVMLGLIACAVADQHFPHLNIGLIAQYALVHDLVEVYAGDTPTLRMPSADAKAEKLRREHDAYRHIQQEFGKTVPWLPIRIGGYEARATPEARFVKALDKLLPKITHILNSAVTIHKQGMSRSELAARYEAQIGELKAYAADFPELFELRKVLIDQVLWLLADQAGGELVA
jgi:5'-deoxynucleotidase YfbR-like HD superfamily hydrolase